MTDMTDTEKAIEYFKSLEERYKENDIHNKFPKFFFMLPQQEQEEILEKEKAFEEQVQQNDETRIQKDENVKIENV